MNSPVHPATNELDLAVNSSSLLTEAAVKSRAMTNFLTAHTGLVITKVTLKPPFDLLTHFNSYTGIATITSIPKTE